MTQPDSRTLGRLAVIREYQNDREDSRFYMMKKKGWRFRTHKGFSEISFDKWKNNKFTGEKIGDKDGEIKKQAKGDETPQRASRQVLGDLGLLFCGDEACDNREDHKRAADEHADNLHGFAVLDAIDKLVEFFKVEVLFKPVFAADLQNTAEC